MDRFKMKNFILIVLVLVNFFLLTIVVSNGTETRRLRIQREESLRSIFLHNGISIDKNIDLNISPLPELNLVRSLSAEEEAVSSLIGKCVAQDLGGSIIYYEGPKGSARFRGTAEFELMFEPDAIYEGSSPAVTAADAVKRLGFKSIPDRTEVAENEVDCMVSLALSYKGRPVFNGRIYCYFLTDSLITVDGRAYFSQVKSKGSTDGYPDACTILMRFLEYLRAQELACGSIDGLEAGYFAESAVVGECVMRPVWRVSTDIGDYFMDGSSGSSIQLDGRE